MATSGSYDITYNRNEVITEAMELCGALSIGETPSSSHITSFSRTLNMMLKYWQSQGIAFWRNEEVALFLAPSTQSYSIGPTGDHASSDYVKTELSADASGASIAVDSITGISNADVIGVELDSGSMHWTTVNGTPSGSTITLTSALASAASENNHVYTYTNIAQRPLFISDARLKRDDGSEIPVNVVAGSDYRGISVKTTTGPTSTLFYDKQRTNGNIYVWPVSNSLKEYLLLNCRMPVSDMDNSTDDFDFPQEWLLPISYNLAVLISPKLGNQISPDIKMQAQMYFEEVADSSKDYASVIFE